MHNPIDKFQKFCTFDYDCYICQMKHLIIFFSAAFFLLVASEASAQSSDQTTNNKKKSMVSTTFFGKKKSNAKKAFNRQGKMKFKGRSDKNHSGYETLKAKDPLTSAMNKDKTSEEPNVEKKKGSLSKPLNPNKGTSEEENLRNNPF